VADPEGGRRDRATRLSLPSPRPAEPPVRLLVVDLDGTVMGGDGVIRPRVHEAIERASARGVIVTIATGRMYRSSVPYARQLGLRAPIICYQGAYVRELGGERGGTLLYHRPLAADVARAAITWSRGQGFDVHVNVDDRLLVEAGESIEDYERRVGIHAEFVPDLIAAVDEPATKVLALAAAPRPELFLADARAAFDGRAHVTVSHPEYLEWTAPGVTKGAAVRWLARRLRVPLAGVMAIGDQHNDLEMLQAVGRGVAMGGAPDVVRRAVRYVTAPVESDGAAVAIEALILGTASLRPAGMAGDP
jgi:Cof subfamily protein (haloacid dehalogenase superfamily)